MKLKWFLQLFAEGDGGEGSAAGVDSADAGQARLRELGVPEDKLKRRANRAAARQQAAPQQAAAATEPTAQETTTSTEEQQPSGEAQPKKSLKDLLAENPEYNEEVQNIVKARLKNSKQAETILGQLAPAIEVLARQYDMDPKNLDYEALTKAINNDDTYYEAMALANGTDVQTAKQQDQARRQQAREEQTIEQQKYVEHFQKLETQAEQLKQTFPDFDLRTELQNPAFARMTHPNVGISVEDAYYAVHRNEIQTMGMQVAAQKTAQKISNAIASGGRRPAEAGQTSQAPSVTTFDYRAASKAERDAFKAFIRQKAAKGEKVYPGQFPGR